MKILVTDRDAIRNVMSLAPDAERAKLDHDKALASAFAMGNMKDAVQVGNRLADLINLATHTKPGSNKFAMRHITRAGRTYACMILVNRGFEVLLRATDCSSKEVFVPLHIWTGGSIVAHLVPDKA